VSKLVNRHQAWAWRIAYRFLGETQNTEDVVQKAFLRLLLQAAPRFSPRAAFRTYCYRIITRFLLPIHKWPICPISVCAKNLILEISTICLRLNFSRALIATKFA
jgi:hypothetical protein